MHCVSSFFEGSKFSDFRGVGSAKAATALKRQGQSVDYREALPHRMDMDMFIMRAEVIGYG